MTEIPEHLLKRSRSARAGKTGGGDAEGADAAPVAAGSPAAAPAPAAAAAVPDNLPNLDPEPVPARPDPHYVTASKARRRIPAWALPVVAALPIWAVSYGGTMQQPEVADPLFVEGALFYSEAGCSGCHGAGGGGSGYPLANGSVWETFPNPIDQMVHVARGSSAIADREYGAPRADLGGARRVAGTLGRMPAQERQLSQVELEMVIFHERAVLSGEDTSSVEYEEWMESMRERFEQGDATAIDLELLLSCADPAITPDATGQPEEPAKCPGPHPAEGGEGEAAAG